jgi:anti-sigma B factor antagonist
MSTTSLLEIVVDSVEDARIIHARGEVDLSSVELLRSQIDAARRERTVTLIDLSEITFMDSSGLHLLIEAAREAEGDGWSLFVVRPSAPVRRVLEVSGTLRMLPIVTDD